MISSPELMRPPGSAPGDCMVFDNTRILHARTGAVATGRRHRQGCYADLDGVASTLAVLRRRRVHDIDATWRLRDDSSFLLRPIPPEARRPAYHAPLRAFGALDAPEPPIWANIDRLASTRMNAQIEEFCRAAAPGERSR